MPGHMRKSLCAFPDLSSYDITEIRDFDDLHHPEGIIRESMDFLKEVYGTRESWYLAGGSTLGILVSIAAVCKPGDTILLARNCHKSVYHAVRLLRLHAIYCDPEHDEKSGIITEISVEKVEKLLEEYPEIRCVILVSPTYEGVVSDINKISRVVHSHDIPLIVDQAHGAHFIFHSAFPESAVSAGADLVVESTHKTLPAMTQTALLHLCSDRIQKERVEEMIDIFETSSPSYILMASAEFGIDLMLNDVYNVEKYVDNLSFFRKKCDFLKKIQLISQIQLNSYDYDISKLVFSLKGKDLNGLNLSDRLFKDYRIELEASAYTYCIGMTSVCTEKEDFDRLYEALAEIDSTIEDGEDECGFEAFPGYEKKMESWEAMDRAECGQWMELGRAQGRISLSTVSLYPPGIPVIVPGEVVSRQVIDHVESLLEKGYNITGIKKKGLNVL